MSRIGKKPITLAKGITVTASPANEVTVKGPKGELKMQMDRDISIAQEGETLNVVRPTEQKRHKALHGLYRSLISNMVEGVTNGYTKNLELVGVGYKASSQGNLLDLALGYSHNIIVEIPKEMKVTTLTEKGKNPLITLEGIDKQLIGQVAAKIRSLRKPEPYKGKGVRYQGEVVRKKAGKSAGK